MLLTNCLGTGLPEVALPCSALIRTSLRSWGVMCMGGYMGGYMEQHIWIGTYVDPPDNAVAGIPYLHVALQLDSQDSELPRIPNLNY